MIDVAAVAQRCLDGIVAVHDENHWPLPERRYVAAGPPTEIAVDDEHLLVGMHGLFPGPTETSSRAGAIQSAGVKARGVPYAVIVARLMRCVPTVSDYGPPTADELHGSGVELLTDVARLHASLVRWRDREAEGFTPNALVTIGQIEPLDSGDLAGHLAYLTISPVQ